MKTTFWLSAAIIAYVYVGYPLLLALWSRLAPRPVCASGTSRDLLPSVSILLAVRNEAERLAARLENLFALDYPRDRVEIIVVSNGSTDATHEVLDAYRGRIRSIALSDVGKAEALNAAAAAARHEVLAFADARQRFDADALRCLVAPLVDARVAGASGELLLDVEQRAADVRAGAGSPVGEGVGLYWQFEKWLRRRESAVHSVLGATGAIYVLRRSAWRPLPPGTLLDDVLAPMRAVLAGKRVVFVSEARAYDRASSDAATEERRKARTLAGNYQLLLLEPRLLVPVLNPVWLQFVSHKVGRLAVPYALVALAISSAALAPHGAAVYGLALAAQVAFYLLAAHGALGAMDERRAGAPRRAPSSAAPQAREELIRAQVD